MSLSEETPSESPCDAYPEDLDVAIALERFHEADGGAARAADRDLGGPQGTFSPDRSPVVGFDEAPGFFLVHGARTAAHPELRRRSLGWGKAAPRGGAVGDGQRAGGKLSLRGGSAHKAAALVPIEEPRQLPFLRERADDAVARKNISTSSMTEARAEDVDLARSHRRNEELVEGDEQDGADDRPGDRSLAAQDAGSSTMFAATRRRSQR